MVKMTEEPVPWTYATPANCEKKRKGRQKREREEERNRGTGEKKKGGREHQGVSAGLCWLVKKKKTKISI